MGGYVMGYDEERERAKAWFDEKESREKAKGEDYFPVFVITACILIPILIAGVVAFFGK